MSARRTDDDDIREIRLEGFGLVTVVTILVVAVGGAFFAGRAWERHAAPPRGGSMAGLPPELLPDGSTPATRGETEVGAGDVFDRADETSRLEPERQAAAPVERPAPTGRPRQPAAKTAAVEADGGEFWVQVFAGRDQGAAAGLVKRLEQAGQAVKLLTEREGAGALYKVRVGSFSTRERAGQAAEALQGQGYSGAWVTRGD